MELYTVIFRTIFFYVFITVAYRMMGKREIGQLGVIDLIISILIAELVAISIENLNEPMYLTILPISLLVLLEIFLGYVSIKNQKFRIMMEGKPSLIISRGIINYHEMVKQRYTLDDLLLSLRQNQIKDIDEVEYAFLEANGKLSVFKYEKLKKGGIYPMPVIEDGIINKESLANQNLSKEWLEKILEDSKVKSKEIFYAFIKNKKLYFIKK